MKAPQIQPRRLLLLLCLLTGILIGPCVQSATAATQIWMGPVGFTVDQFTFPLESTSRWAKTLGTITAIELYIRPMAIRYNEPQRRALANILNTHHISFVGVSGGIDPSLCRETDSMNSIGDRSAEHDFQYVKTWLNSGGSLAVLTLDGSEHRLLYSGECEKFHPTLPTAAHQIADYLTTMTRLLAQVGQPRPRFHIVVNFPNWDFEGLGKPFHGQNYTLDYSAVLEQVVGVARDSGVPIEALEIDYPKAFGMGERMRRLVQKARGLGLQIGMFFNTYRQTKAAGPESCSYANHCNPRLRDYMPPDDLREQTFLSDVLDQIAEWRSTVGTPPDYAIIMSWMMHPRSILPETTFGTLSYDVLAAQQVLNSAEPAIFGQRALPLGSVQRREDQLTGWAYDPDETGTSIFVHVYKDIQPLPGRLMGFVASVPADKPSGELDARIGIKGKHAFSWEIPADLLHARHTWYVYGVDTRRGTAVPPGLLVPLRNSPVGIPQ